MSSLARVIWCDSYKKSLNKLQSERQACIPIDWTKGLPGFDEIIQEISHVLTTPSKLFEKEPTTAMSWKSHLCPSVLKTMQHNRARGSAGVGGHLVIVIYEAGTGVSSIIVSYRAGTEVRLNQWGIPWVRHFAPCRARVPHNFMQHPLHYCLHHHSTGFNNFSSLLTLTKC